MTVNKQIQKNPKPEDKNFVMTYTCPKHGDIQNQVLRIGVFDEHRNFKQKIFCGVCHFEMLEACTHVATENKEIPIPEKSRIIMRK